MRSLKPILALCALTLLGCPSLGTSGPSGDGAKAFDEPTTPPEVTGLSQAAFLPGDRLTLLGAGFHPLKAENQVHFEGASASAEVTAPDRLEVVVPTGVRSGALWVSTPLGRSGVAPYVVDPPQVASVSLDAALPGKNVTLTGRYFSPVLAENQVLFNGVAVKPVAGSGGMLVVQVAGTTGPLTVRTGAGSSAPLSFVVIPPLGGSFNP
ncbi:hypothetical protein J7643_17260 [bacterium]|nr:hypothetical protein [bacterium]